MRNIGVSFDVSLKICRKKPSPIAGVTLTSMWNHVISTINRNYEHKFQIWYILLWTKYNKHFLFQIFYSINRYFQMHCWDFGTPIEETLSTFNDFIRHGKVRYLGASNLTGWQLQKIVDVSRERGWESSVSLPVQGLMKTCVPEAGIKGRDKYIHPTVSVGCNYFSLALVPASGT